MKSQRFSIRHINSNTQRIAVIFFLTLFVAFGLYSQNVCASSNVTINTDQNSAKVSVTLADSSLQGKEISVVCYSPSWNGDFTNMNANKGSIVYLNQYTASSTTSFSFTMNQQPVGGDYTLVISSSNGRIVQKFKMIPVISPISTTIGTPDSLKVKQVGSKEAKLTWNSVSNASSYIVYRSSKASSGFEKIGTANTNSYVDKKAKAGKTWYYQVSAVGSSANLVSPNSSSAKISMLKAVSISAKSKAKGKVAVSWKKVSGVNGYKVFVATKKNGKYSEKASIKGVAKTKTTLKKLKSKKTYYVQVRAYKVVKGKKVLKNYSEIKSVKVR